jgi:di/tricarboxylate transporter
MTGSQIAILVILAATVLLFLWGRWRHDVVAMAALLACVVAGLVQPAIAFSGFGHPAVITVACVLILSRGLQVSGAVDVLTQWIMPTRAGPVLSIAALTALAAVLSAVMNNVGALALLMPVGIQVAAKQGLPPGRVLMPVAFGSILGGMTTLIGTPPNLIVSGFRVEAGLGSFGMFDFTPVGLAVAAAGVLFIALVGWRLVPARERSGVEGFVTGAYLTEGRVHDDSKSIGKSIREIGPILAEADAHIVGLVRDDFRVATPHPGRRLRAGDILVIEAEPESLATALTSIGLKLVDDVRSAAPAAESEEEQQGDATPATPTPPETDEFALVELTVPPGTGLVGRTATEIELRTRHGINLLALSRRGKRSIRRLRSEPVQAGDVLLMQGPPDAISSFAAAFACVPLAPREIRIPEKRQAILITLVMAAAVGGAAFGLLPAAVSFAAGVVAAVVLRVISARNLYEAIDWPVIVLLGALIPVAGAMETTGAADLLAKLLLENLAQGHAVFALALILIVTMTLSDFMNNAATAAVMCPIAISSSGQLGVNPDAFLMAVAIGASCAFLTPIGHQNNTLILGPGGFRFGDYWKLGLPVLLLFGVVSVLLVPLIWSF